MTTSCFVNKVRLINLGFMKALNLSQRCTGTEVITSDNDYSYRLHCNNTQEPQSQLKASLYWPLSKESKITVPAPADLWGKKKETSRYIRAQGNNSIVFLNML